MMRALCDMDTIQIELTNACIYSCSNCTRFCGHRKPYFMSREDFEHAVDSMVGYPKMTGFMGGEPLLHPEFEEFCLIAKGKIPPDQLGLWTCLPKGFEKYAELICETFGHIFVNDHTRDDIYHAPLLVASEEVFKDKDEMFYVIHHCWLQDNWSASINPKGAFFCEIAASLSLLMDGSDGWPVESGWWWRTPKDFTSQIEEFCPKCGCCAPLQRRKSTDGRDDISQGNLDRLKGISKKIKNNDYILSDLSLTPQDQLFQMAKYKEYEYRIRISQRYGMGLRLNEKGFLTPYMSKGIKLREKSLYEEYKENFIRSVQNA